MSGTLKESSWQKTETFKYIHPNSSYSVEVVVTKDGAHCPGCGENQVNLLHHIKKDELCKKKCQRIELDSFSHQLYRFGWRKRAKQKQKDTDEQESSSSASVDNEDSGWVWRGQDTTLPSQESFASASLENDDSLSATYSSRGRYTTSPSQEASASATVQNEDSLWAWRGTQESIWQATYNEDSLLAEWRGQDTTLSSQGSSASASVENKDTLSAWRGQDTTWAVQESFSSLHPCFVANNIDHPEWFGLFMTTLQLPLGVEVTIKKGRLFVSSLNGHTGQLKIGDKLVQINGNDVRIRADASEHEVQCLYENVHLWLSKENTAQLIVKRSRRGERQQRIDRRERYANTVNSLTQHSSLPPFSSLRNWNRD